MSVDPAVRAALLAAARRNLRVDEQGVAARHHQGEPWPAQIARTGAAIAEFLHVLHQGTPLGVIMTDGGETYTADCARLAAAVEKAAS